MKTKLLLSTLTLGLLAGVYVWQAQAQNNAPTPAGAQTEPLAPPAVPPEGDPARRRVVHAQPARPHDYKLVVQPLPRHMLREGTTKAVELEVLSEFADWEIVHTELLPEYEMNSRPNGRDQPGSWPAMVYTLRKAK